MIRTSVMIELSQIVTTLLIWHWGGWSGLGPLITLHYLLRYYLYSSYRLELLKIYVPFLNVFLYGLRKFTPRVNKAIWNCAITPWSFIGKNEQCQLYIFLPNWNTELPKSGICLSNFSVLLSREKVLMCVPIS